MSYLELIEKALKGRSINATAKAWGLPQKTLDVISKGEYLPNYQTAMKIAEEAGVPEGEVLKLLAQEELERKTRIILNRISTNFEALLSHLTPRPRPVLARW